MRILSTVLMCEKSILIFAYNNNKCVIYHFSYKSSEEGILYNAIEDLSFCNRINFSLKMNKLAFCNWTLF